MKRGILTKFYVFYSCFFIIKSEQKCDKSVSDSKWSELVPFLNDVVNITDLCDVSFSEGHYYGQVGKMFNEWMMRFDDAFEWNSITNK